MLYWRRFLRLLWWLSEESDCNARNPGSVPGSGRCPGEGNDNPLQYSCLEKSMNREAWWTTVHGVSKSRTELSDSHTLWGFFIEPAVFSSLWVWGKLFFSAKCSYGESSALKLERTQHDGPCSPVHAMWGHQVPWDASHPEVHGRNEDSDLSQGPPHTPQRCCLHVRGIRSSSLLASSERAVSTVLSAGGGWQETQSRWHPREGPGTPDTDSSASPFREAGPGGHQSWVTDLARNTVRRTRTSEGHRWFLTAGLFITFHPQSSAYKGLITNHDERRVTPRLSCVPSTLTPQITLRNLEQLQRSLMSPNTYVSVLGAWSSYKREPWPEAPWWPNTLGSSLHICLTFR